MIRVIKSNTKTAKIIHRFQKELKQASNRTNKTKNKIKIMGVKFHLLPKLYQIFLREPKKTAPTTNNTIAIATMLDDEKDGLLMKSRMLDIESPKALDVFIS